MNLGLKISDISRYYGEKLVLDKISLNIKKGDIFGFVGLNGAGKTTLIKIILDLIDQDQGEVEIFSQNKYIPSSRQSLCYLPEKFQPSNNLKGIEFIKFTLEFYQEKLDSDELKQICQNLDLPFEVLNQKVTNYSKGMTQKLGLISVFLSKAKLIILDEPMSGLDPKARIRLKKELLNYKKQGNTIFFSSHILSDIDEVCDEIGVLHNSKIVFNGKSSDFKNKYDTNDLDQAFLKEIKEI